MNPFGKAAQFLVRLAGYGIVSVSAILLLSNIAAVAVMDHPAEPKLTIAIEVACFAAGCAILWKNRDIARRLAGDLWEDEEEESDGETE
jgi:hypothetical protein